MGKSRLLATWRQQLPERTLWLEGQAFYHTMSLPYGPFLDLLRRLIGIIDQGMLPARPTMARSRWRRCARRDWTMRRPGSRTN